MPEKNTMRRARRDKAQGKSASTQAGEFVREEIHHVRKGKHGARSPQQAIAIGLSKAHRAGVDLPQRRGAAKTKRTAAPAYARAQSHEVGRKSPARSRATMNALEHEPTSTTSKKALSRQARGAAARRRSTAGRSESARKASRTKGPRKSAEVRKASPTRSPSNSRGRPAPSARKAARARRTGHRSTTA